MHKQKLVVGTRSSQLALWQADFVIGELAKKYPELVVEKIFCSIIIKFACKPNEIG